MTAPANDFPRWIKHFASAVGRTPSATVVVFPHAGGAAAAYRPLATALSAKGAETFIVQYPQRGERLRHPGAATIADLATELFDAGNWRGVAPLDLFGHCMGAVVAFEFARVAEAHGVPVRRLWPSAGQAPSTVAESGALPTTDADVLADMVDLGGTDPRLLDDQDFVELLVTAVQADYRALSGYSCATDVQITADIHAVGGDRDHRIDREWLRRWESHTAGRFELSLFDGGHFYIDDHLDEVAGLVSTR